MTPEEDEEVIFVKRQKIIPSRPSDDGQPNLVPIETQNSSSSSSSSSCSKSSSQNLHFECFVCGTELHQFDEQSKEFHLNQCLDKFEQNSEGIRSENYGCMLCGLSLRGKALIIRCQHIKRCSKIYGIGIRELLHMIAPEKYQELFTQIDNSTQLVQETHLAQKPNANDILMANARLKWNQQSLAPSNSTPTLPQSRNRTSMTRTQSEPKRGRENSNTEIRDYAPEYKKVIFPPMTTPIIVDGFTYASPTLSDCYILTHFHSDHYSGLSRTFEYGKFSLLFSSHH